MSRATSPIFRLSALLFSFLVAASCGDRMPAPDGRQLLATVYQGSDLTFETFQYERSSEGCRLPEGPCAQIVVEYPRATRGPRKQAAFVNDSLSQYVRLTLAVYAQDPPPILPEIDILADQFIENYQTFLADNPDYPKMAWTLETKGQILFQNQRVVGVELKNFSYTGGAHPNSFDLLLTFDLREQRILEPEDLIADRERFEAVVQDAFRAYHDLGSEASLSEAGFFWGEPFALPENVTFTARGLKLVYNPYEIAPYATGPTVLEIPYSRLEGMLVEAYR